MGAEKGKPPGKKSQFPALKKEKPAGQKKVRML